MRAAVRARFRAFTEPLEGVVPWMYQDVLGLVTIGIGNLIDPMSTALSLPFVRPDGSQATREEIAAQWQAVKNRPELARLGHRAAARFSNIRLTDEGIDRLVSWRLDANEKILAARFPEWDQWPADAQLAAHSLAWACGPGWPRLFPRLSAALERRDFEAAAGLCTIREDNNPGVRPRNKENRIAFRNAAVSPDPEVLYWPAELPGTETSVPELPKAPTLNTVRGLQTRLQELGYDPGPIDGVKGPKTTEAVRLFQAARGLRTDGVAGPATLAALAAKAG